MNRSVTKRIFFYAIIIFTLCVITYIYFYPKTDANERNLRTGSELRTK